MKKKPKIIDYTNDYKTNVDVMKDYHHVFTEFLESLLGETEDEYNLDDE